MKIFDMFKKQKQVRQKECTIILYLNSKDPISHATRVDQGNSYAVHIHKDPFRTQYQLRVELAHEIGHCVEDILGNQWNAQSHGRAHYAREVDTKVLQHEAAAWRFAIKMFPSIRQSPLLRDSFRSYTRLFKKS